MTPDSAATVALQVLRWLAEDGERLGTFLAETGLDGTALRARMADTAFLGGVLDYLLADEGRLLEFCAATAVPVGLPGRARRVLPGATPDI